MQRHADGRIISAPTRLCVTIIMINHLRLIFTAGHGTPCPYEIVLSVGISTYSKYPFYLLELGAASRCHAVFLRMVIKI